MASNLLVTNHVEQSPNANKNWLNSISSNYIDHVFNDDASPSYKP